MVQAINKRIEDFRLALLIGFLIVWLLKRVMVFEFLVGTHFWHYVFASFSLILLLWDLLIGKRSLRGKGIPFLMLLIVVMVISTAINHSYDLIENISTIIFVGVQYFLFYSYQSGQKIERVKHDFTVMSKVLCALVSVFSIAMLLTYLFNLFYDVYTKDTNLVFNQGYNIYLGRVFGLYYHPATIILSVAVIGLSFYLYKNTYINSHLCNFYIFINYLAIVLSGARSVKYSFYIFVFTMVFFCFEKKLYIRLISAIMVVLTLIGTSVFTSHFLPYVQQKIYSVVPFSTYTTISGCLEKIYDINGYYVVSFFISEDIDSETGEIIQEKEIAVLQDLERYDLVGTEDSTNGRKNLWMTGLNLFKKMPLFGTSPRGMTKLSALYYPESMLAQCEWPLHCGYLDVLVQTGMVGTLFFVCFILCILSQIVKYLFFYFKDRKKLKNFSNIFILISIIVAFCAYLLVESDVFLQYTIQAMTFWWILGAIISFIKFDMEDNGEEISDS